MRRKLFGVRILAMVLVEDILLYSHTFSEKCRDRAGLTRKTRISIVPNLQEQYAVGVRDLSSES